MTLLPTAFTAGATGQWRIDAVHAVRGETLPSAAALRVGSEGSPGPWLLRGSASHARYTTREGLTELRAVQSPLDRPQATRAALIPIRKSAQWWALAQDERTAVFGRARHHAIGLPYAGAIARSLYHSRDLGEPFDFLTWFEFAPEDAGAFEALLAKLRASEEWDYVEREVDIRLSRA